MDFGIFSMKLIVGLGNPGKKYKGTRHSVGFWLVDRLCTEPRPARLAFGDSKAGGSVTGDGVRFFKNSNFINDSGIEVKKTISFYKILLGDVLVIHDDFDLELGQFKLQSKRSSAGHKGVRSVIDELGSKDFWRLRVGVDRPPAGVEANDYVLERFSSQEQEVLDSLYPQILTTVKDWLLRHSRTEDRKQKTGSMSED